MTTIAISRYRNTNVIDGKFYETSNFPTREVLDRIPTFTIRIPQFERLDNLAFKHLGAGEYWWVIAIVNDLDWAFGFEAGQEIRIPIDVQDVLRLF